MQSPVEFPPSGGLTADEEIQPIRPVRQRHSPWRQGFLEQARKACDAASPKTAATAGRAGTLSNALSARARARYVALPTVSAPCWSPGSPYPHTQPIGRRHQAKPAAPALLAIEIYIAGTYVLPTATIPGPCFFRKDKFSKSRRTLRQGGQSETVPRITVNPEQMPRNAMHPRFAHSGRNPHRYGERRNERNGDSEGLSRLAA